MEEEIWKDVVGYEGFYKVSNLGRIMNVAYYHSGKNGTKTLVQREKILKPWLSNKGYEYIELKAKDGAHKTLKVHRIVLSTFTEPHEDLFVNHKNLIKTDNRLVNLEWVTNKENIIHAIQNGAFDNSIAKSKVPIEQYSMSGEFLRVFESACDAAKELGCRPRPIGNCCDGAISYAYGFRWKRVRDSYDMYNSKPCVEYREKQKFYQELQSMFDEGKSNEEISEWLGFSLATIRIFRKNGIHIPKAYR